MTLTVEQVRETRFHLAKRGGYRHEEVDAFVDRVETTLAELADENATLTQQVSALKSGAPGEASEGVAPAEGPDAGVLAERDAQIERLNAELAELQRELDAARQGTVAGEPRAAVDAELQELRAEVERLRAEAATTTASVGTGPEAIVVRTAAEASPAVARLLQMSTEQAESLVAEARAEAERLTSEAQRSAEQVTTAAQTNAEQVTTTAQTNADRVTTDADERSRALVAEATERAERIETDARSLADSLATDASERAAQVDADTTSRRQELFATLESERDELSARVDHLRDFENRFRESFVGSLQRHIEAISQGRIQPDDVPELLADGSRGQSATPRLDALLAKGE
ncbi:MAG: DivIVA domain-containing protein [Propionibacteriaceae bacterium]|nr:DivIVA domain-containing protein [Propionibacteriaceae bacterium]